MKSNVSLVRRLGSMIYDLFLVFSLVFFVSGVVIIIISNKQAITSPVFFFLCPLPLTYAYFALSWVKGKQTLGMKAWKFEIAQSNGEHITYAQSFIRFFLSSISLIGLKRRPISAFHSNRPRFHFEKSTHIPIEKSRGTIYARPNPNHLITVKIKKNLFKKSFFLC